MISVEEKRRELHFAAAAEAADNNERSKEREGRWRRMQLFVCLSPSSLSFKPTVKANSPCHCQTEHILSFQNTVKMSS